MLARLTQRLLRPAINHWQGQHRWPVTLLVSVVGMTYLYYQALLHLPLSPAFVAIACWVVVGGALLTWQIVGTLKAVNLSMIPPADVSSVYGGYITILVAVILVSFNMMDGITRHFPKPAPQALMDSSLFKISIDYTTQTITVDGEVNYGSIAAVEDLLKRYSKTKRIVFNSEGGHIFAARSLAQRIIKLGLDTHVIGNCFSACTIAFIAGAKRTLGRKARLGFHRYAFANQFTVQTVDAADEQQKDLEFFRTRGIKPDFLKRVFDANHANIWQPDHATLYDAAVITDLPQ